MLNSTAATKEIADAKHKARHPLSTTGVPVASGLCIHAATATRAAQTEDQVQNASQTTLHHRAASTANAAVLRQGIQAFTICVLVARGKHTHVVMDISASRPHLSRPHATQQHLSAEIMRSAAPVRRALHCTMHALRGAGSKSPANHKIVASTFLET
ncbi:hypothetical protein COEREDRAFT_9087 [Coemansia reversa NRRL 1564]|uniref:Uncharacterized protein n=1 Tax=Coemansia reversa (strain ATCC 12441 / NRRL 1564) TaxID=763665 RepID=A0A2G5BA49_COERN|nr:hypothetical protein COEREDRAFT_9087 [Coemansia reversa NRRL 1564]|eukprot:PIA15852.1 hypothetical protein COEREDRAFT_9087 [Coemansia reversa NRRL 1564]